MNCEGEFQGNLGEIPGGEVPNGEMLNGKAENGEVAKGKAANGKEAKGEVANGKTENGKAEKGEVAKGKAENGKEEKGEVANGKAENGEVAKGKAANGKEEKGEVAKGKAANGKEAKGEVANGKTENGKAEKGEVAKGKAENGKEEKGEVAKGKAENGKEEKGEVAKGKAENGKEEKGEVAKGKAEKGEVAKGKAENGKTENGKEEKGEVAKGKAANGKAEKGEVAKGKAANGKAEKGEVAKGKAENGKAEKGEVAKGKAANGKEAKGEVANGKAENGKAENDHVVNSKGENDKAENGKAENDDVVNSKAPNGKAENGKVANDNVPNGKVANGEVAHGEAANDDVTNGVAANGEVANGENCGRKGSTREGEREEWRDAESKSDSASDDSSIFQNLRTVSWKEEDKSEDDEESSKNSNFSLGVLNLCIPLKGKGIKTIYGAKIKSINSRGYENMNEKGYDDKTNVEIQEKELKKYRNLYTVANSQNILKYNVNDKNENRNVRKMELQNSHLALPISASNTSINRTYHDKMLSHLFGLAILFYGEKMNISKMSKKLPKDYYECYKEVMQNISNIYENNFTHVYDEFYDIDKKNKPLNQTGIEKYYYAFNRIVYTFLFFLCEQLQKEDALHLLFQFLPMDFELYRDELIERVTKTSPSNMNDIYYTSYKYFDSMCTCFDLSTCFNFSYISNTLVNNLKKKNVPNNVAVELSKINEYISNAYIDIVEYIKDLSTYFKLFFDYADKEGLFSEPVLFCYSLFFDYYLDVIDVILDQLNIHIKNPINDKSEKELLYIYNQLKIHHNNVGSTIRCFYFKNNLKYDPLNLIESLFSDNAYRLLIADKYMANRYTDFIYLMLNIIDYIRVLVASVTVFLNLQTVASLLSNVDNGRINFYDAMKFLSYFTKYQNSNISVFKPTNRTKQT
ncbi:erythrocyte vesicle protein 1, putative (EVP1) [Plasmodium ovale wallikeri]|uniref:Erythrocyte vesicle protein 1, putative (EVP1) n=1 Tax=Plasmodium ovale wallikeri TaxID=864142 RepID=A0A1A8YJN7_PLAOA|nr:erythrocyte vesicle protein 1, putative (EVP1) [Plasmodium ovale wallikeri]